MSASATFKRFRAAALAAGLALTLGGCESFDLTNLIPDSKKKLPGERREVFPGGTPGVPQGVPPELVKGYQAPPETPVAEEKPPEPKKVAATPKPKARPKPKPTVAPEYQQQSGQAQPAPAQQGQWPQQQKPAQQSAWPASPAPGTFSR